MLFLLSIKSKMNPGNRIGIPSIIPFARRKSETTITPQAKNRDLLSIEMLEARLQFLQGNFNAFQEFESTGNANIVKETAINVVACSI